jgi:hypothetical protein
MYLSRSLILALDEGRSYSRIEVEPNTSRPKISRWKVRFEKCQRQLKIPHFAGRKFPSPGWVVVYSFG